LSDSFNFPVGVGIAKNSKYRGVMPQGLALTAGGIVLGAAASLASTRLIVGLLFQVSPRDPLAFGIASVSLVMAALAACFLPAWRAARTDPVRALRDCL
jgi:putative ABC transport system permease protein